MFMKTRLACSFCGKNASEVSKLVAGPKVYICDLCVATASRIMSNTGDTPFRALSPSPSRLQRFISQPSRLLKWFLSRDSRVLFAPR